MDIKYIPHVGCKSLPMNYFIKTKAEKKEKKMAKNWEKVEITVDRSGKAILAPVSKKSYDSKEVRGADFRKVKSLSFEDLKKEGDAAFTENSWKEDDLLNAYNKKKIKSNSLIQKAKVIAAKRAKEEAAAQKKASQKARRDKIVDTNTAVN